VLGIPSQAIALGTSNAYLSTKQPELSKAPLFFRIVNTNSGLSITGAMVWFDGYLAGSSDQFGVVGISVKNPSSSHNYVISASGYQVVKGTVTIGSNSDGHLTVKLVPDGY
jgi:hypothetical protein